MSQKTELEILIQNLEQTKDPLKEIEAQAEFLANELGEGHIRLSEYVHRLALLSQTENHFKN